MGPARRVARRADVIVCHGGFGSTLGALAHGTPLVVLPLFSNDQWANGEAVARAGAGITVADDASERKVLEPPNSTTINELARRGHLGPGGRRPIDEKPIASPPPCAPSRRSMSRSNSSRRSRPGSWSATSSGGPRCKTSKPGGEPGNPLVVLEGGPGSAQRATKVRTEPGYVAATRSPRRSGSTSTFGSSSVRARDTARRGGPSAFMLACWAHAAPRPSCRFVRREARD